MRLSPPRVSDILAQFDQRHRICLVPLAPFSVHVYEAHARACLAGQADPPQLACVAPWGREPSLSAHWVREIQQALLQLAEPSRCQLILTAHSLPTAVLASGDPYREQFEAAATSIAEKAGDAAQVAYQSQGQGGGAWLGPTLLEAMTTAAAAGKTSVLIAPVGFMAEHLETLYDLDIEARAQAQRLGLVFARLRAPGTADGLIEALATAARQAMNTAAW